MRVFFDNCTAPVLAETLNGFLAHLGSTASHVRDLPCGRGAGDAEWVATLARTGDRWFVVTGDGRFLRNRAQRLAFRQAGLSGLVLAPAFGRMKVHEQASALIGRWPEIASLEQDGVPVLFELPVADADKIRRLQL